MGTIRPRPSIDGSIRYLALYRDAQGRQRSAGTYATEKLAEKACTRAESLLEVGRLADTRSGRQRFADYVTKTWLPHHELETTTRQRYVYSIEKYLLPEFGRMKMAAVRPAHVRAWITKLKDAGVSASTINDLKTILSAIFTTALNDQIVPLHPCRGVKTPTVARKPRTIITADQFDQIHAALPNDTARLLIELAIESGLRWGELVELRPLDLNFATNMLTVNRAVVEVNTRFRAADSPPFEIKAYPKDREFRRVKVSRTLIQEISEHIKNHTIASSDLLFPLVLFPLKNPSEVEDSYTEPEEGLDLGRTEPNRAGRTYRHGTLTGYSLGSCRCIHCRHAYATYRAKRRADGKDDPRPGRTINTDGHLPRRWFSKYIWKPTLHNAGLQFNVRVHDLRHAHASWLLAGGADLQAVKERLGHGSLRTTEKYLHTLPDTDDAALDAFNRIRHRNAG